MSKRNELAEKRIGTQRATTPLSERFAAKVARRCDHECWTWLGSKDKHGYGHIGRGGRRGKTEFAHRVALELHTGENPGSNRVLHSCDNPSCVNPSHLRVGTQADNIADMERRGRSNHPASEDNGRAKWSDAEMVNALDSVAAGQSVASVARNLGVDVEYFRKVVRGKKRPRILRVARGKR